MVRFSVVYRSSNMKVVTDVEIMVRENVSYLYSVYSYLYSRLDDSG